MEQPTELALDYPLSGPCDDCGDHSELYQGRCAWCRSLAEARKELDERAIEVGDYENA